MDSLIILLLVMILVLAFGIGAQDETMSTVFGSGSLKLRSAMILAAILAFFGVIFLSATVGKKIGSSLLGESVDFSEKMMLALLISTSTWLIVATKTRAPISTTHSVVGGIFGIAVVWAISTPHTLIQALNWGQMGMIVLGWVVSPILGYFGAMGIKKLIDPLLVKYYDGLNGVEKIESYFRKGIIVAACINQLSRAGNDSANALGVFIGLTEKNSELEAISLGFLIITAISFVLGLVFVARHLVRNVGSTTGSFRPSEALAIELTVATIMLLSTILGFPVSGGHILVFAMIGYARTRGELPEQRGFKKMVFYWSITFPIAAILSGSVYAIILII